MPTVASGGCCCGVLWRLFLLAYVAPIGACGDCLDIEHSSTFFDNVIWGPTNEDVRAMAANSVGMTTPMDHDLDSGLLHSEGQPFILNLGNASLLDILSPNACAMGIAYGMDFSMCSCVDLPFPRPLGLGGFEAGTSSHHVGFMDAVFDIVSSCAHVTYSSFKEEADVCARVEIDFLKGHTSIGPILALDDRRMDKYATPFEFAAPKHKMVFVSYLDKLNMTYLVVSSMANTNVATYVSRLEPMLVVVLAPTYDEVKWGLNLSSASSLGT